MTLTTRLSTFFLAALAAVLVSFSIALIVLASLYLDRQLEAKTVGALDILTAGVESTPDGVVEWEPNERMMAIGRNAGSEGVRWSVTDHAGHVVDGSDPSIVASTDWRTLQRTLGMPSAGLTLAVSVPRGPIRATIRLLASAVIGLSLMVWSLCALLARRFCRRALAPVLAMAAEAREMRADDVAQRLSAPPRSDELGTLVDAFNDLLTRRHEAFARQSRFTGDASHQLRTPLAAMLGQMEVALRRDRPPEEYRRVLEVVHSRAIHLRRIVELMLFLARADLEAVAPDSQTIDLNAWLTDSMARHTAHRRLADIAIEREWHEPLLVRASTVMLDELFDNLLDNATKYSNPGSLIQIALGQGTADTVSLRVSDQGSGIDPAELPEIFDAFRRGRESRRLGLPGVGLGLSVARRITEALGATIAATSERGHGTTFTVIFPQDGSAEFGRAV